MGSTSAAAAPDLPFPARFARPGKLPSHATLPGRVAVLDLAFDAARPERDLAWAQGLGERLAVWMDHHEQECWKSLLRDPRFVLVPREMAPACPPLVTAERVRAFGPVQSILAHGDLDGVLAAAKWMVLQQGLEPPAWLDPDSVAADTRRGAFTPRGDRLDRALRGAGDRDQVRRLAVVSVLAEARGATEPPAARAALDAASRAADRAREMARQVRSLAVALEDIPEKAVLVDLRAAPGDQRVDVTELMLDLQKEHDWVVVFGRQAGGGLKILASCSLERTGLDLRREFGVQGFAPFRVHLTAGQLLARLPSARLRAALARPR